MAYVSNMPADDEDEKDPNTANGGAVSPAGGGNAVHLAPSAGVGSAGATGGTQPATPGAGGSFATLDKYVGANQGQAANLSGQINKGISSQYNALDQGNQSTLANLAGTVSNGYTPLNQGALSQEAANPVSFASDPNNVNAFKGQLNDKYTGPQSAESDAGFQKQQSNINNAIAQGQAATQTEAGRKGLLQGIETTPNAGVTALNSAILSEDPAAQGQIENAYQPFSNLLTGLSTGAQGINQNISKAQADATNASATANKQIADQTTALTTGLNNTLTADQGRVSDYNSAVDANRQNTTAPFAALNSYISELGLPGVSNPFASYQNEQSFGGTPTVGTIATPQDYATANALSQLAPGTALPLDQANAAQAGTYVGPSGSVAAANVPDAVSQWFPSAIKAENQMITQHGQTGYDPGFTNWLGIMQQLNNYVGTLAPDYPGLR